MLKRCLKVRAGFFLAWRPLWLGVSPGVPVSGLSYTACSPFALVLLSWWWWWEENKLQTPLSRGSDIRYSFQNSATARFGTLGIKLTSNGCPRYRTHRCHSCFIYRYLVIQVDNPKAIMSLSEAEPGWWKVLLYLILLLEVQFHLFFLCHFCFDSRMIYGFNSFFGETSAGLGSRGTRRF